MTMKIYDKLVEKRSQARANKDTKTLALTQLLIGEIERKFDKDKRDNDDLIVGTFKAIHGNWSETYALKPNDDLKNEIDYISQFLPQVLSEEAIKEIATNFANQNMGAFMKHMKENHPNQYDGKLASNLYKEIAGK